jgi:hypothetical protein
VENLTQWLPIAIEVIVNVVLITLAISSLGKKIAVTEVKIGGQIDVLNTKLESVAGEVSEIKSNHLSHLNEDIRRLTDKVNDHLISCK